ncbi:hypothetical protein [Paenibacillus senegalensis]|uniref:hypothetical protein n=1 Tax=Paenibacillus senegalensis TaxID=1465766 RepID=UPI00028A354B|nr:hypothetical protein [Paenibacillus senegalensis]
MPICFSVLHQAGEAEGVPREQLLRDGFEPFSLDRLELEERYYGEQHSVSHRNMERYFMPYINEVLFPRRGSMNKDAFHRYSRRLGIGCEMQTQTSRIPLSVLSVDVTLCPYELGFVTIRTRLEGEHKNFSEALEFVRRFRVLENISDSGQYTHVHYNGEVYEEVEQFVFSVLADSVRPYMNQDNGNDYYFETLPFFVDERMYAVAYYRLDSDETLEVEDCYRAIRLDGLDANGNPYISSSNPDYIRDYCSEHAYDRWAPTTYHLMNDHTFCCITNQADDDIAAELANKMFGEYYYGFLLNFFHKIVLLKLSDSYSHVKMEKNNVRIQALISDITRFSAKHFPLELVAEIQGKEMFTKMRERFSNLELYARVKKTLEDLFQYQNHFNSRKQSLLLFILTLYSVIGGIYGMNQVIDDLEGNIDWSKLGEYSPFEYFALFVTFSGLVVALLLGINVITQWKQTRIKNKSLNGSTQE